MKLDLTTDFTIEGMLDTFEAPQKKTAFFCNDKVTTVPDVSGRDVEVCNFWLQPFQKCPIHARCSILVACNCTNFLDFERSAAFKDIRNYILIDQSRSVNHLPLGPNDRTHDCAASRITNYEAVALLLFLVCKPLGYDVLTSTRRSRSCCIAKSSIVYKAQDSGSDVKNTLSKVGNIDLGKAAITALYVVFIASYDHN